MSMDYKQICQQVFRQWQDEKVPLNNWATEKELRGFEEKYGIRLPEDFRYVYSLVNGMNGCSDNNAFMLWSLTKIQESQFGVFIDRTKTPNKIEITFGDFLIDSHRYYLVSNCLNKYYVNIDREDDRKLAATFTQFLIRHLTEPDAIHYNGGY